MSEADKPRKQYVQRGGKVVLVRVSESVKDRVQRLADARGVTIRYELEQLLEKPLRDAERAARI
jgi:predicted transcriptional regulator